MLNNKRTLIIGFALVIILIIVLMPKPLPKKDLVTTTNESTETKKDEVKTVKGGLFDLLKAGTTQKCTFNMKANEVATSGTTYIADSKMKGDFTITMTDGKNIDSHMIMDGGYLYTWTSQAPQGVKIKIDTADATKLQEDFNKSMNLKDFQDTYDFKCGDWVVGSDTFSIPTDIKFMDLSTLNVNGGLCSACDYITDATAKAECKSKLGC